jgi:hypothetical protein
MKQGRVIAVSITRTREPILRAEVSLASLRQALQPCTCDFCRNPGIPPETILARWGANIPEAQLLQGSERGVESRSPESDRMPPSSDAP